MEEKIDEYLSTRYYSLWGRFYDIRSKEGYREAKEFILDLLIDLGIDVKMEEEDSWLI